MGEGTVDISVIDHFKAGTSLDKKKKRKILDLFKYLAGGDSPIEAVELTVRRDRNLREAQLKAAYEMVKLVENPPTLKTGSPEKKLVLSVLISSDLLSFVIRLLWIRIPDDCTENNEQQWKAAYFNSLMVLKHILTLPQYMQTNRTQVMENNTVEALLDFCDTDLDYLACYPAVCALKTLCCLEREACDKIVSLNALPKIGNLILKDNCQKMVIKAYRRGHTPFQKQVLNDRFDQSEENFKEFYVPSIGDSALNVLRSWSWKMQMAAAVIILQIAEQNDQYRKLVYKEKIISKAILKWLKTPGITASDCNMIAMNMKIIAMLCLNEELGWQFIDRHGIMTHMEDGVLMPNNGPLNAHLEAILQLSTHSGRCRNKILENEEILKTLARYMFSYHKEIQDPVLRTIANLAESDDMAKNLIKCGITPKSITLIITYYQHPAINHAQRIEKALRRTCEKEWTQEEIAFGKERYDFFECRNEENAQILKDKGNQKFKLGLFEDAVRLYTEALNCMPHSLEASKAGKDGIRWWVLPAVLYSNRAQCHLNNCDWDSALSDCNEAMARCLEDNDEADKILIKTVFRRFRAYAELGQHLRALNDITFCLRNQSPGSSACHFQAYYWEMMIKYRESYGMEPIRRCGNCVGGEGDKLKRCANCEEYYCSRECQVLAWELGHKNHCKK
ncbi:uncharacterized protein LOC144656965 [Oculina patagonica]